MKSNFEIKINKEIRDYTESIFFGLSLRQSIFSIIACGIACGIFFLLNNKLGTEITSWLCMLGAAKGAAPSMHSQLVTSVPNLSLNKKYKPHATAHASIEKIV